MTSDDGSAASAANNAAAAAAGRRRIASIGRHVQPTRPLTTSSAASASPSSSPSSTPMPKAGTPLGTLKLGPNVSIPVFEARDPTRLPSERLLLNLDDPLVLEHLEFLGKKWQLRQDVFLLAPPGPYARRLSLTFAALLQLPYEYISFHRDIGEAEMLQSRSLTADGSLVFVDGPVVRAMKEGHLLILEGVERAERGVTPVINNILENREQNLADGSFLIPAEKIEAARSQEASESAAEGKPKLASRFIPVHPNFRVISIGTPIPPYKGLPLDPPFRSRFQARWVEGSIDQTVALEPTPLAEDLCRRWSNLAALLRFHTTLAQGNDVVPPTLRLPNLPTTATSLLQDLTLAFPPTRALPPIVDEQTEAQQKADSIAVFAPVKQIKSDEEAAAAAAATPAAPIIAASTLSALSTAYPQICALDKDKHQTLGELLAQLRLDQGLGVASESAHTGAGYLGYNVASIERVDGNRAKITFTNAGQGAAPVSLEVPCGPLPLGPMPQLGETVGQDVVITPRVLSIFTRLVQLHAVGRDICLVPGSLDAAPVASSAEMASAAAAHKPSSSTTTCISLFASALGYAYESVWLWKDLGGGELLMRRSTAPDGSTGWEPAPLIRGAMQGKLIHLAGVDVLGPTLSSLSRLLQDRESELWNGQRISLGGAGGGSGGGDAAGQSASGPLSIPDSFRVVLTATKAAGWLSEEAATLFATCITTPMDEAEEREIVLRRTGIPADSAALKRLFVFVQRYRQLSSDPTLGLAKSRRLGTRQVIRMASRLTLERRRDGDADEDDYDLHGLVWRTLLVDFLPSTVREVIQNLLQECKIHPPGSEGAFRYVPRLRVGDPEVRGRTLEFDVTDTSDRPHARRVVPRFDVDRLDPDGGAALVPDLGGSFYNNPQQSALLLSFAEDLELLGEHLLLMGSQGTGKNKLIDRTLELLNRPREYIQMNRDSTVGGLLQQIALENGQIRYYDSPLVRAVKLGRILVVDEVDKCSTSVSAVFRSLAERGELTLPDGRRIRPVGSRGDPSDVIVHPSFRLALLSNRPSYPFLGQDFIGSAGEGFSCYAVANPDIESEVRLLHAAAPSVDVDLLRKLDVAFHDLRDGFDAGLINHPYSLRELLHLVAHMERFPDEKLSDVLLNALSFDLHRPEAIRWVVDALRKRGLPVDDLDLEALRNRIKPADALKITFEGMEDYDPKKAGRSTDLDRPKEGKEDPNNEEHVGGNTWRGGTGGRDTAGLGGRGGYERLYKGHKIHRVSKALKDDVPDHIKRQARAMARAALEKQLKENGLAPHEAVNMHELNAKVAPFVQHLANTLNDLKANEEERAWVSRQQDGELDERRLSEGLMGERAIYKRRSERPPEIGAPQLKPKRIRIVLDASASMYSMQFDGRLQRELEVCLMVMQAFARVDPTRFALDIVGHSGDNHMIPLVGIGKLPRSEGDQYRVLRSIVSHTQYCESGDFTLKCIEHSIRDVKKRLPSSWLDGVPTSSDDGGDMDETVGLAASVGSDEGKCDDHFVIAISDANLARYGINPHTLSRTLGTDETVKTAVLFIDKGNEAVYTAKQLPGKAFVAREMKDIPRILSTILTSSLAGGA
ncbi:uncharacterized protein PSFLO_05152 [Pseudozyma flocculosa]|nr:uncharacterized protein PSFLO_05152 [Pseudozyma flocculosa]